MPLLALLVVALTLRPQLSAVGPLAPGIIDELGTSHAFVGLLTTIPVLCMGIFAPFGPALVRFVGVRAGIAISVGTLVLFATLRPLAGDATVLLVLTFGVGVGTALVGPILPMFVRSRLPGRMVAGTASYAAGIILGAAVASTVAVPLGHVLGGWRGSLLTLSLGSLPAIVLWVVLVRGAGPRTADGRPADPVAAPKPSVRPHLPFRRPVAWLIGLLFGMQSWIYYGTMAWLASVYIERGWEPATAALLLTLVSVTSLSAIVGVPYLSARGASRRSLLASAAASSTLGLLGVALLPVPAVLWASLLGIGLGVTFTLVLTLPTDISDDPRETGGAAALMFLVGYILASLAPFALGAVRDATATSSQRLASKSPVASAMMPLAWILAPHRLRPATAVPAAAADPGAPAVR